MTMVMMSQELMMARNDLQDLKDLKEAESGCPILCPMCDHRGTTVVQEKRSQLQWAACTGCVCIGCWLGCCLVPFCVSPFKDYVHYCSSCNHPLGKKGVQIC